MSVVNTRFDRDVMCDSVNTKRLFLFSTYSARSGSLPPHDSIEFDSASKLIWDTQFSYLTNDVHDAGITSYLTMCFYRFISRVSSSEYERYYKRAFQAHNVTVVDDPLPYSGYLRFLFVRGLNQFFGTWLTSSYRVQLAGPGSAVVSLDDQESSLSVDLFQFSSRILDFRPTGNVISIVFSPLQPDYDPVLRAWSRSIFDFFHQLPEHFSVKSDRLRAGVAPCDVDVDGDIVI